jgi:glycosyltransferase involved in cell wall biosynthesis
MRIGLLSTSYPRHRRDPAGRFVAELAGWLAETGDPVEVLAPHPARSEHPKVRVKALRYALSSRLLYRAGAPDNLRTDPRAWLQIPAFVGRLGLEAWLRSRRWDRVLSHWLLPSALVASLATRQLPHLAVAHSSDVHLLARLWAAPRLLRRIARPRTALVLTSEALREPLLGIAASAESRRLVEDATVVRMGIGKHRFLHSDDDLRQRLHRQHELAGRTVVLFIGRLVPVKGLDHLLEACGQLSDRVAAVVMGDGPERRQLEQLATRLGLPALFLGEQGGTVRDDWLRAADLLALPSAILPDGSTDSAPVVLLEAMAAGLPVMATEVGGNAELIRHGETGLLVPPGQPGPLRETLARLVMDPRLRRRLGTAGREQAKRFTWDRVGAEIRELLVRL